MTDIWAAVGAISAAVSTLVVLAAAAYAAMQLSELKKTRGIQSLLALHERYQSPQLNAIRHRLRDGQFRDFSSLSKDETEQIGHLLNQLELISVLADRGLVDAPLIHALFPGVPYTVRNALPFIVIRRQTNPEYARTLERFARTYD